MSDKLKQFINDNRDDFDSENLGPHILKKIETQLEGDDQPKKTNTLRLMRRAAVFGGVIILSVILYYSLGKTKNTEEITEKSSRLIEEPVMIADPVYAKQISLYQEMIGLQQTELKQIEKEQPELYRQFESDINTLDSAYGVLKTTLAVNPNTEMLLEAMIQNLQLQTDLLNRQLIIIKEIKQKKKAHEKNII